MRGFVHPTRGALPNASLVGFTVTPIEKTDANARAVFGDFSRPRNLRSADPD